MRYAQRECADCHVILPANQMVSVTDRTKSGESVRRSAIGGSTSTTEHFSYRRKLICPDCAQRRFIRAVVAAVALGLLVVGYLVFSGGRANENSRGSSPTNLLANDSAAPEPQSETTIPAEAKDAEPEPAPDREDEAPIEDPSADRGADEQAAPELSDADRPDDGSETANPLVTAVQRATIEALERGGPASWRAAGKSGYVVVSEPQAYEGRTCRNVYGTAGARGDQTQSATHLWCQPSAGGEWAPAD